MAVILGNKYQSKQRDNFRKIVGISDAYEKIAPENYERIYGSYNAVYFNGNTAASGSTGQPNGGGGDDDDPNKPGGGGGGGGGGGLVCVCQEINAENITNPCCLSGTDCDTGEPVIVDFDSGEPLKPEDCQPQIPTPTPENPLYKFMIGYCQNINDQYAYGLKSDAKGTAEALSAKRVAKTCENANRCNIYTTTATIANLGIRYTQSCKSCSLCSGCVAISACRMITDISQIDQEVIDYYAAQDRTKRYFKKDGKFYNSCDPYGDPPISELTLCNSDGDQFKINGDGSITPL